VNSGSGLLPLDNFNDSKRNKFKQAEVAKFGKSLLTSFFDRSLEGWWAIGEWREAIA
jgi:hypothetical protein